MVTEELRPAVEAAIATVTDRYLGADLLSNKAVKQIEIIDGRVIVNVLLGYPADGYRDTLSEQLSKAIQAVDGVTQVDVTIASEIITHSVQGGVKTIAGIKNIIAIASGKGGVGKSTTAVNLALALAAEGANVGILDADIYGPSQPRMLGSQAKPESRDGKSMEPVRAHGLQTMSIGYLIDEETPMIWRGPMATQALEQLIRDTNWDALDYLIVDLPPGTGDVQLTLSQKIPVSAAVIVTTPQDIALLDARKALKMFEKVEVPVLGVVENMSTHICSQCGHEEHIFGAGGAQSMADQYGIQFLGALPLDIRIRQGVDVGQPSVVSDPDGEIARTYREIACRIAAGLSLMGKDFSAKFPNIVIQNS